MDWSLVTTLGDERIAQTRNEALGMPKTRYARLAEYKAAVRAHRMLTVTLQAQGLAEDADRFAFQAQVLQRQVLRFQRKAGAYLFSWLLAALAGYGYRLRRIFVVYALVVLLFAAGYSSLEASQGAVAGAAHAAAAASRRAPGQPQRESWPCVLHPARPGYPAILAGDT